MEIIKATEARQNFQDIVDHVHYTKTPVIISKRDKPWVMIQPLPGSDKELSRLVKYKKKRTR